MINRLEIMKEENYINVIGTIPILGSDANQVFRIPD